MEPFTPPEDQVSESFGRVVYTHKTAENLPCDKP
jgi:hypothetical protein